MASSSARRPPLDADAYGVLGVEETADAKEIKRRYHALSRAWHPDVSKHADAEAVFAHIARAYKIVGDPQLRVVYDFAVANGLPMRTPERFEALYARMERKERLELLARNRHTIGWALALGVAAAFGAVRVAVWNRARLRDEQPASTTTPSSPASPPAAAALSPTPPSPPSPAREEPPHHQAFAVGGLLGGASAGGSMLALGASGGVGARFTVAAALGGALGGRALVPWAEAHAGQLRATRTKVAHALVAWSRPLCEAVAAVGALILLRRSAAAQGARWAELHLRALRAGLLGAGAGHGLGRAACSADEVRHAAAAVEASDEQDAAAAGGGARRRRGS